MSDVKERLLKILDGSHDLSESQLEDIEEAVDDLKELEAEVKFWQLKALDLTSPWIPVSDRFPDDHHPAYWALDKEDISHKVYIDGGYDEDDHFIPSHWIHSDGSRRELNHYTHWIRQPDSPDTES